MSSTVCAMRKHVIFNESHSNVSFFSAFSFFLSCLAVNASMSVSIRLRFSSDSGNKTLNITVLHKELRNLKHTACFPKLRFSSFCVISNYARQEIVMKHESMSSLREHFALELKACRGEAIDCTKLY